MNQYNNFFVNEFFKGFIGNRGLRVYKSGIDGKMGLDELRKPILSVTSHQPKDKEAYAFFVRARIWLRS